MLIILPPHCFPFKSFLRSLRKDDLTIPDNKFFAIINHLMQQHKPPDLDKIYNELIKIIDFEHTSKEYLHDKFNELIIQENIVNKPNKNDDLYRVNEGIVDFKIEQLECSSLPASDFSFAIPNTKQSSSIGSKKMPRKIINNILETPNLPQKDIDSKESVRRSIEAQTFNDNISEKMKIESLKTEIISSLESTIYSNCICQIDNLRKEIEKKTKLLTTQQHLTTSLTIFF